MYLSGREMRMVPENSSHKEAEPNRTNLALDRTILANERTYAAWIRTGLSSLIAGLAVEKFLLEAIPLWGIHVISITFIVFSGVAFFLAAWRYRHLMVRLEDIDIAMVPLSVMRLISLVLILSAVVALVGLWRIW
jgi:putative membrane protein